MKRWLAVTLFVWLTVGTALPQVRSHDGIMPSLAERFADGGTDEIPDFQRHVAPLFGRLGCNGRACHGSFQGRGGFRLSLFGYDFASDYRALKDPDSPRIDLKDPLQSLILVKPTDAEMHEGGKRYEENSWQYHVFRKWIEAGAPFRQNELHHLARLHIEPSEIHFRTSGETVQLRVVAEWQDGTREDVTPLCRFKTNDEVVATVDPDGKVQGGEAGDTHIIVFYDSAVVPIPVMRPVSRYVGSAFPDVPTPTPIDRLVVDRLRELGIVPSDLADDATFLRRVSLDLTGTLPSSREIRRFLADSSPDKRARKIDELLDSPAYAAWWTTRLCDWTGNNGNQLVNVAPRNRAPRDWYDWIYDRVAKNVPYDQIVEGIVLATSREPGESYRDYCRAMSEIYRKDGKARFADRSSMSYYWARRNFRKPEDRVIGFAYSFLGIRIQCAQCHKHPFDQWSKDDFARFRGFFTSVRYSPQGESRQEYNAMLRELGIDPTKTRGGQLRRELLRRASKGDVIPFPEVFARSPSTRGKGKRRGRGRGRGPATAKILGEEVVRLDEYSDPRIPLMDWLRSEDNPYFARAFVNRVWASYFGTGIVDPPDDLNLANPPSNAPLLDYLAKEFIAHRFDMKWLHRTIVSSDTYQRDWRPNETNLHDRKHFSRAIPRRLDAEVAYDAVLAATASRERNASMRVDLAGRAIASPGPQRRRNDPLGYALNLFGRSTRESNCDCDRSIDPNLLQTVFLQNDRDVIGRIRAGGWLEDILGYRVAANVGRAWKRGPSAAELARRNKAAAQRRAKMQRRLGELQQQLQRARRSKAAAALKRKQIAQIQQRIKATQKALAKLPKPTTILGKSKAAPKQPAHWDPGAVIDEAYLRTLSRLPTRQESAAAEQFFRESDNAQQGIEGLLWALINTKEFIVNH